MRVASTIPAHRLAGRNRRRGAPNGLDGFTVVELVVVMAIVAIIAALAAPRFFSQTAFDERAYADEVAAALRVAQKVAVATGCPVRVVIDGAGYAVQQQAASAGHCDAADATFPTAVRLPDGEPLAGPEPAGVALGPATTVVFDALGATDLAANRVFVAGPQTFTLEARSGLVLTP